MDTQIVELCAYHESARVAYAYQCGYYCESIELSEFDAGAGVSKLNGGPDNETIQLILSNKAQFGNTIIAEKNIQTAKNLMKIYCAGSCAEIFFKNNKQIPVQTEIEIPGQDIKYINLVQSFLQNNIPGHPTDYASQIISQIFRDFTKEENWKVIEVLAHTALKNYDKKIPRFYIEDALMKAGFKPVRQPSIQPIEMEIREDNTPKVKTSSPTHIEEGDKILNDALKKFLGTIKRELNEEEIAASVDYLKSLFKRIH